MRIYFCHPKWDKYKLGSAVGSVYSPALIPVPNHLCYLIISLLLLALAFSLPPLLLYPLLLFHPQLDQCKSFIMECHVSTVNEAI